MRSFFGNPAIEWLVLGLSMMGVFVVVKLLLSYLPDGGILGAIKTVGQVA